MNDGDNVAAERAFNFPHGGMTGPDELRKACHLDDDDGVTVTRCWGVMLAAADAWDHDNYAHAVEVAARDLRIEKLKKAIELQHQRFHCHQWESEIDRSVAMSGMDSLAALAGEE